MRGLIVLSDCVWPFCLFFSLAPLPAAGHRSYIQNKHICKHGPDEDDLDKGSEFYGSSRLYVIRLRSGKGGPNFYKKGRPHVRSLVDRATERATERTSDRAIDRATDRPRDRSSDRVIGRATERSTERPTDRSNDRAIERPTERPNDRPSDRFAFL